jgi:hypothetical protein
MLFAAGWILEFAEGNLLLPDYCALLVCCSFLMNRSNLSFSYGTDPCVSSILYLTKPVSNDRRKEPVAQHSNFTVLIQIHGKSASQRGGKK